MTPTRQLLDTIEKIKGSQFVGLTYRSKGDNKLSRYTLILGFRYITLIEKSITELEAFINEGKFDSDLHKTACDDVMASLKKSLVSHQNDQQNPDYTKKDQYLPVGNGLNINKNDGTVQLFGLRHSEVVLEKGFRKPVNSRPLTIEKNKVRGTLSISRFREFALDQSNVLSGKVSGNEFVMEYDYTESETVSK